MFHYPIHSPYGNPSPSIDPTSKHPHETPSQKVLPTRLNSNKKHNDGNNRIPSNNRPTLKTPPHRKLQLNNARSIERSPNMLTRYSREHKGEGYQTNRECEKQIEKLVLENNNLRKEIIELKIHHFYQIDAEKLKGLICEVEELREYCQKLEEQLDRVLVENDFLKRANERLQFEMRQENKTTMLNTQTNWYLSNENEQGYCGTVMTSEKQAEIARGNGGGVMSNPESKNWQGKQSVIALIGGKNSRKKHKNDSPKEQNEQSKVESDGAHDSRTECYIVNQGMFEELTNKKNRTPRTGREPDIVMELNGNDSIIYQQVQSQYNTQQQQQQNSQLQLHHLIRLQQQNERKQLDSSEDKGYLGESRVNVLSNLSPYKYGNRKNQG